jgi:anti-sigma factor RsiW
VTHSGELLSAYLDGELTPQERADVDGHVAGCAACRNELDDLAAARRAVRGLPMLDVPAAVVLPVAPARRPRRRVVAWAASLAAVAVVALGVLTAGGGAAPAFDLDTLAEQHTARVVVDPGIATVRAPEGAP